MDILLLALLLSIGIFVLNGKQQRQRIGLLASHLAQYQIEKLLEKLIELRKRLQLRYSTNEATESKGTKPAPTAPTLDDIFLQKIRQVIEAHLDNSELGIAHLCDAVHLSHTQMFRKLKALTGQNPTLFIRKVRLQKAVLLLQTSEMNISEIAYAVGFSDPNYFSRAFHEEFGKSPSLIRK